MFLFLIYCIPRRVEGGGQRFWDMSAIKSIFYDLPEGGSHRLGAVVTPRCFTAKIFANRKRRKRKKNGEKSEK